MAPRVAACESSSPLDDLFAGLFGVRDPLNGKLDWDADALDFLTKLAHPDRHPPELQDIANRATATVAALRRYAKDRAERERAKQSDGSVNVSCDRRSVTVTLSENWEERSRRTKEAKRTGQTCGDCGTGLNGAQIGMSYDSSWTPVCLDCLPVEYDKKEPVCGPECPECGRERIYRAFDYRWYVTRTYCSTACMDAAARKRRSALRREQRKRFCEVCLDEFTPDRKDGRYCKPACRQKAYRQRQRDGSETAERGNQFEAVTAGASS